MAGANALSREELAEYFKRDKERLSLQRKADDLAKANEATKKKAIEHVRANGGKDRTTVCFGYVLSLRERAGFPAYKEELIKVAGVEAVDELRKRTPPIETISIEPEAK